ncbi:MAG: SdpI family protein [Bacteroidetes bacterium]|nr:SdpI family protein [Bacteroidota bacterium]
MEQNTTTTTTTPPSNPNAGKGMGIAGMILGIVAIIVSFVPCFGWWAVVLAVVGLILSAVSMSQAQKAGASKGMAIAGLICSIIAIIIGSIWIFVIAKGAGMAADQFKEAMEKSGAMDSLNNAMERLKEITDTTQTH